MIFRKKVANLVGSSAGCGAERRALPGAKKEMNWVADMVLQACKTRVVSKLALDFDIQFQAQHLNSANINIDHFSAIQN